MRGRISSEPLTLLMRLSHLLPRESEILTGASWKSLSKVAILCLHNQSIR